MNREPGREEKTQSVAMEMGTEPITNEGLASSGQSHRERRPEEDKVWLGHGTWDCRHLKKS